MSEAEERLLKMCSEIHQVTRFFSRDDGVWVVGWEDTGEVLLSLGGNAELHRVLGDVIVEKLQSLA